MRYFLDFDRTLFDTDAFIPYVTNHAHLQDLGEVSEDALAGVLNDRAGTGLLSFEPGELTQFVYPDVTEFLRTKGTEAVIITFGNPALQKIKVESALAGILPASVFYTGDVRKGPYLATHPLFGDVEGILVDDRAVELEEMNAHCPQIRTFQMVRTTGAGDGRWSVIHSLTELP